MKKLIYIAIFISYASILSVNAQSLRVNIYGNYAFDDKVNLYNLNARLNGGFLYGGGLEYMLGTKFGAEAQYQRMDSEMSYYYSFNGISDSGNLNYSMNYMMAGFNNYILLPAGIEPYYGLLLGVSVMNIQTNELNLESNIKFAWGARVGAKIALNRQLSLRLQAELRSIVESVDANLNIGIGGINPGISTNSMVYQFNLGAGLVYVIK